MNMSKKTWKAVVSAAAVAASATLPMAAEAATPITNTIDLTGVSITGEIVSDVTFDRLMFAAKTQAQLNAILAAFSATTPISIDPTGLTENMVIPNDYPNVFAKTVPGVTIKRTANGFMLIVK